MLQGPSTSGGGGVNMGVFVGVEVTLMSIITLFYLGCLSLE